MVKAKSVHSTQRKTAFKIVGGTDFDPGKPQASPKKIDPDQIDRIEATDVPTVLASGRTLSSLFSKIYWQLPFVTLPQDPGDTMGEFWGRVVMWNDEPTGNSCVDYHRGRRYAYLAIEAIRKDDATNRQLEITVERMLEGAFRRRGPSGKLCRKLSNSEEGFIDVLCVAALHPEVLKDEAKRRGWQ
jgi:hypothetical protein